MTIDHLAFARMLIVLYWAKNQQQPGRKAWAVAAAELRGALKAADRLGLAETPFALELAVLDAIRSAGDRPSYRPFNNQAQQDFDECLARDVCARMSWPLLAGKG